MKRTVLDFALRADAVMPLDDLRPRIEGALGCTFSKSSMGGQSVLVAQMFGMKILLSAWRGLNRRQTFSLQSLVDDVRFLDEQATGDDRVPHEIDIGPAIIDLLAVNGAGDWRIPSRAEIDAEIEYLHELERSWREEEENFSDEE